MAGWHVDTATDYRDTSMNGGRTPELSGGKRLYPAPAEGVVVVGPWRPVTPVWAPPGLRADATTRR